MDLERALGSFLTFDRTNIINHGGLQKSEISKVQL